MIFTTGLQGLVVNIFIFGHFLFLASFSLLPIFLSVYLLTIKNKKENQIEKLP
jgi:hypothetical protein